MRSKISVDWIPDTNGFSAVVLFPRSLYYSDPPRTTDKMGVFRSDNALRMDDASLFSEWTGRSDE